MFALIVVASCGVGVVTMGSTVVGVGGVDIVGDVVVVCMRDDGNDIAGVVGGFVVVGCLY